MPTAVEYAVVMKQSSAQNSAPVLNALHSQNGAGGGPPALNTVVQLNVPSAMPSGEWLLTGPLAALLLMAAVVVAAVRRQAHRVGDIP
jgi:hypothetical protein